MQKNHGRQENIEKEGIRMDFESVWSREYVQEKRERHPVLEQDAKTDVLIVGAGIAGILCAFWLKQAGVDCMLVEQREPLSGVTKNTTAKITVQHALIYDKILKMYGLEKAQLYYQAHAKALQAYQKLAETIPCDFEEKTAWVYHTQENEKWEQEIRAYEKIGIPYLLEENPPLPLKTQGALGIAHQAQFHPLKFLHAVLDGLEGSVPIYQNTPVLEISERMAKTPNGTITANHIILATHYPMVNVPGLYFMKLYQHRSYVAALKGAPQLPGMYIDESETGFSFRNYKDLLFLGGGGHRTGKESGGYHAVYTLAEQAYPQSPIVAAWAAQDCMSLDGIPYIGVHSRKKPYLYVASGFQKWGMTGAMTAAMVLRDCIVNGTSEYESVFSPQRSMCHPQLLVNLGVAVSDFVVPGKRCSHLGCRLKWNPQEHTWDCPCHGSRFHKDGSVIENPAKRPIAPKKEV